MEANGKQMCWQSETPKTLSESAVIFCKLRVLFSLYVSVLQVQGRQRTAKRKQGTAGECVYASAALKCPQQEENEAWEKRKGLHWPLEAHLTCAYLCLPVGCLEQVVLECSALTQGEKSEHYLQIGV